MADRTACTGFGSDEQRYGDLNMAEKRLAGVMAPIGTPFVNEEVSLDQLKSNMGKYAQSKLSGYFAIGSNGECVSLSREEKLAVLEVILANKADHQIVMAGAGTESTRETINFCKTVASMGVDYVSVLTPSYFKKKITDEAMAGYYIDVADSSPVPVVAYNAPGFTGVSLSGKVVKKIAGHVNIHGVKDTSPGQLGSLIRSTRNADFAVLSGTANTLFAGMMMGATGGVISLANAFPDVCTRLYELCMAGEVDKARELHTLLGDLNSSVSGSFGVAGVKYATEVAGFYGGDPRLPLLALTEDNKRFIRDAIAAVDLSSFI